MLKEVWESEGPRKISVHFEYHADDMVYMSVTDERKHHTVLHMDMQEFKSMLKAGLRFDEAIS